MVFMKGPIRAGLRQLTKITRPLALRSAGKQGSSTSVVRHVGRKTGRSYETPVVAVEHDGSVYIALPYGERTDWLKNACDWSRRPLAPGEPRSGRMPWQLRADRFGAVCAR